MLALSTGNGSGLPSCSAFHAHRLALDCSSASSTTVSRPALAARVARAMAVVVLPTPPLMFTTATIIITPL